MSDITIPDYHRAWRTGRPPEEQSGSIAKITFYETLLQEGMHEYGEKQFHHHWVDLREALNQLIIHETVVQPYRGHSVALLLFQQELSNTRRLALGCLESALDGLHQLLSTEEGRGFICSIRQLQHKVIINCTDLATPPGTSSDEALNLAAGAYTLGVRKKSCRFFGTFFDGSKNQALQEEINRLCQFVEGCEGAILAGKFPKFNYEANTNWMGLAPDTWAHRLKEWMKVVSTSGMSFYTSVMFASDPPTVRDGSLTLAPKLPDGPRRAFSSSTVSLLEHCIAEFDEIFLRNWRNSPSPALYKEWLHARSMLGRLQEVGLNKILQRFFHNISDRVAGEEKEMYDALRMIAQTHQMSKGALTQRQVNLISQLSLLPVEQLMLPTGEDTDPVRHKSLFLKRQKHGMQIIEIVAEQLRNFPLETQAKLAAMLGRAKKECLRRIDELEKSDFSDLQALITLAKSQFQPVHPDHNAVFHSLPSDKEAQVYLKMVIAEVIFVADERHGHALLDLIAASTFDHAHPSKVYKRAQLLGAIAYLIRHKLEDLAKTEIGQQMVTRGSQLLLYLANITETIRFYFQSYTQEPTKNTLLHLHRLSYLLAYDLGQRVIYDRSRINKLLAEGQSHEKVEYLQEQLHLINLTGAAIDLLIQGFDAELLEQEKVVEKEEAVEEVMGPATAEVEKTQAEATVVLPVVEKPKTVQVDPIDDLLARPNFAQLHVSLRLAQECRQLPPSEDTVDTILDSAREIFEATLSSMTELRTHNLSELYEAVLASGKCSEDQLNALTKAHTAILRLSFANNAINYGQHKSTLAHSQEFSADLRAMRKDKNVKRAKSVYLNKALRLAQVILPKGDTKTQSQPVVSRITEVQLANHQRLITRCQELVPMKLATCGPNQIKRALALHHLNWLLKRLDLKLKTDPHKFPLYHQHHGMLLAARSLQLALRAQLLTKPLDPKAKSQKGHSLEYEDNLGNLARKSGINLKAPIWLVRALPILKHPHLNAKKEHEVAKTVALIEEAAASGTPLSAEAAHGYLEQLLKLTYEVLATV